MSEQVNHPQHYGGENNPYEAIKVIEAWDLDFHLGNTVKYIPRLNDWRSNITSRVGTSSRSFRWVVYGGFFGDETLQGDITTGNYWSSAGVIVVVP